MDHDLRDPDENIPTTEQQLQYSEKKESEKYFYSNHNFSKGEMSLSAASYYSWCRLLRFPFLFFFLFLA